MQIFRFGICRKVCLKFKYEKKLSLRHLSLFLFVHLVGPKSLSYYDVGYDSIVKELSKSRAKTGPLSHPLENIKFHGGVGFVSSFVFVEPLGQESASGFMRGFQASLGIDLFSKKWSAETAIRSFGTTELEEEFQANLQEFDLKVVYRTPISQLFDFRLGGGLAARYLEITLRRDGVIQTEKFTTPSSVFLTGLDAVVSDTVTIGAEVAYRSSMIDETADRKAIDASLRVDAHF